ncbi:hypothetical protein [Methanosarcina barkeri]|uniref:hypothetical protein n=1 Tax=Methanosarcina barkeri TaxID=2208 RepID=UPI00003C6890|nr:hypothetical protein [Methanosarcina barkeri]
MGDSAIKIENSRLTFFISIYHRTSSGSTDAGKVSMLAKSHQLAASSEEYFHLPAGSSVYFLRNRYRITSFCP